MQLQGYHLKVEGRSDELDGMAEQQATNTGEKSKLLWLSIHYILLENDLLTLSCPMTTYGIMTLSASLCHF